MSVGHFASAIRGAREAAGVKVLALAAHLGLTEQYLYDLERGRRAPLRAVRIDQIAAFLGVDPLPLQFAAARDRGHAALPVADSTPRDHLAIQLATQWPLLSDEQVRRIQEIVARAA